jgi:hypothetical protein
MAIATLVGMDQPPTEELIRIVRLKECSGWHYDSCAW